jgi:CheY-like chemotaxis protein
MMGVQRFLILLVEDDEADANLFMQAMKKANLSHPIQRVSDGTEAIEYLEGHGKYTDRLAFPFPSIAVVDLKMPRMSGLQLLAWIRDHNRYRTLPTIVVSGSSQHSDVVKAYELGANSYIAKPSSFDDLVKTVQVMQNYWSTALLPGDTFGT